MHANSRCTCHTTELRRSDSVECTIATDVDGRAVRTTHGCSSRQSSRRCHRADECTIPEESRQSSNYLSSPSVKNGLGHVCRENGMTRWSDERLDGVTQHAALDDAQMSQNYTRCQETGTGHKKIQFKKGVKYTFTLTNFFSDNKKQQRGSTNSLSVKVRDRTL